MTIPGLPKHPSAESIAIDEKGDYCRNIKKTDIDKIYKNEYNVIKWYIIYNKSYKIITKKGGKTHEYL